MSLGLMCGICVPKDPVRGLTLGGLHWLRALNSEVPMMLSFLLLKK